MAVKKTPAGKKEGEKPQLRITLVRSLIGYPRRQKETAKGLGLRKINSRVIRPDRPEIRGMIDKISHLVEVEVVEK
ncbi:MAG: 50S ribosomal protein L30 [Candidatus Aminicenantes bacterium]|nr:50S ribosomal protein L30 [Candidatus Aminicenantes bacterium]